MPYGFNVTPNSYFFKKTTLPANTTPKLSDAVKIGNNNNRLEVVVVADNAISLADANTLEIEVQASENGTDWTLPKAKFKPFIKAAGAAMSIAKHERMTRFGISRDHFRGYLRLQVTGNTDLSANTITAFLVWKV